MGLVLDVGHANTTGTLPEFLECRELAHVHLHDNFGESDEHLPIGKGGIDFEPIFRMIEKRGITAVLEQKSEQEVLESLEMLTRMFAFS